MATPFERFQAGEISAGELLSAEDAERRGLGEPPPEQAAPVFDPDIDPFIQRGRERGSVEARQEGLAGLREARTEEEFLGPEISPPLGVAEAEARQRTAEEFGAPPIAERPGGEAEGLTGDIAAVAEAGARAVRQRRFGPDERGVAERLKETFTLLSPTALIAETGEALGATAGAIKALQDANAAGDEDAAERIKQQFDKLFVEQGRAPVFSTTEELGGLPSETKDMALLRVLGGAVANPIKETIFALPVPRGVGAFRPEEAIEADLPRIEAAAANVVARIPDPATAKLAGVGFKRSMAENILGVPQDAPELREALIELKDALGAGSAATLGSVMEQAQAVLAGKGPSPFEFTTFEDALLGTTPEKRGLVSDVEGRSAAAKVLIRAFEGIERGAGLAEDVEASVVQTFGDSPTARRIGFATGFVGDIVLPWEGIAAAPFKAAGLTKRAGAIAKALPTGTKTATDQAQVLGALLRGHGVDVADATAASYMQHLQSGEAALDDFPEWFQVTMRAMADDTGQSLDDIFDAAAREAQGLPSVERAPTPPEPGAKPTAPGRAADEAAAAPAEAAPDTPQAQVAARIEEAGARIADEELALGEDAKVRSMEEYDKLFRTGQLRETPVEGAKGNRPLHGGGEALRWLDPEQTIESPRYRLVPGDESEEVVGTLEEVLRKMLQRQRFDDIVEFGGGQRRVANWSKPSRTATANRDAGRLVHNRDFSLPAEKAFLDQVKAGKELGNLGERARIPDDEIIRQLFTQFAFGLPPDTGVTARKLFQTFVHGVETSAGEMGPAQRELNDLIADAYKAFIRSKRGAHRLVNMSGDVWVTPAEAGQIKRRLISRFKRVGLDTKKMKVGADNVLTLDEKQLRAVQDFASRHGIALPDASEVTVDDWIKLQASVLKRLAGRSADAKWAIRGSQATSDAMLGAVFDATGNQPGSVLKTAKAVENSWVRRFWNVDRKILPKSTLRILDELTRSLSTNGSDLLREMKAMKRAGTENFNSADALQEIAEDYRPIPAREVTTVDSVARHLDLEEAPIEDVLALRKRVLEEVKDVPESMAGLLSNDPAEITQGLRAYVHQRRASINDAAKDLLSAMLPQVETGKLANAIRDAEDGLLQNLWRGFMESGMAAPEIDAAAKVLFPTAKVQEDRATLLRFVLNLRARARMKEATARLLEEGLAIAPTDTLRRAVDDMLFDRPLREGGKIKYDLTEAQLSQAYVLLRRWGLDEGAGVHLETFKDVVVPATLQRELERMQRLGITDASRIFESNLGDMLFRQYKMALTVGAVIPNAAYFATNLIGVLPIMLLTRGIGGTSSAFATMAKNPGMVSSITKDLSRYEGSFRGPTLDHGVFHTDDGRIFTRESLTRAARKNGLDSAEARVETTSSLGAELDKLDGQWGLLKQGLVGWQDMLMEVASSMETSFRVGVFLDELKVGKSTPAAAETAREALYDYNSLTEFERRNVRKFVVFYSFMRKNQDATWKAMADNPTRVLQQIRFARDQQQLWGRSENEMLLADKDDLSRFWIGYNDDIIVRPGGRFDERYKGLAFQTGMMGTAEPIFMVKDFIDLAGLIGAGDVEAAQEAGTEFLGMLNPVAGVTGNLVLNTDIGTGFSTDSFTQNEIPGWMANTYGFRALAQWAFAMGEAPLSASRDPDRASHEVRGTPKIWAAGAGASNTQDLRAGQQRWQVFKELLGRTIRTTATADRATSGINPWSSSQPRPWAGTGIELLEFLVGIRVEPQLTEEATLQRAIQAEGRDIRGATETARDLTP